MTKTTGRAGIGNDAAMTDAARGRVRAVADRRSVREILAVGSVLNLAGPFLVALPCLLALVLGFTTYASYGLEASIGIAVGAAAIVAMSETLILAARLRILEPIFGGLDRIYRVHKWLGISALLLMILHDLIEPDFGRSVRETGLGEFASDAGEIVFNALLALIAISWFRRLPFVRLEIPYHLWRFSHRFMGVLFAVVMFHQFFVDMPTAVDPLLSTFVNVFGVAGLIAWVYTEFVAPRLRRRQFSVSEIRRHGDNTAVTLMPTGKAMRWRPGQFAFFSSPEAGMSEPHPFTIASALRPDGALTVSIRALGGWTRRLPGALREGMCVQVEGPYGRFDFRKGGRRQIWLAGGIGVTPFLAWAESLAPSERRDIHLVYSVRKPEEAIGLDTLQAAVERNPRFSFEVVSTVRDGRLTPDRLISSAPFPVSDADLWFCGPTGLKDGILRGLKALGQEPRRVRFEHFEFA